MLHKDRREQILDAAQKVFAQKGFDGASIKDLTKAARVSPGLLYWYFDGKSDLFASLVSERLVKLLGLLAEHLSFDLPPEESLPQFGCFYVELFEQGMNAALFKLVVTNAQSFPPSVRKTQADRLNQMLDLVQGYFRHQIDAGRMHPCDTEMAARTFMGSLVAFLLTRHVLRNERTLALSTETVVKGITDIVLRGSLPLQQ